MQCHDGPLFHLTSEHSGFSDLGRTMPGETAGSNYRDCTTVARGVLFVKSPDWAADFPACTQSRRLELPREGRSRVGGDCRAQVDGTWTQSPARAGGGLDTHPLRWEPEPRQECDPASLRTDPCPSRQVPPAARVVVGFPQESQMEGRPGCEEGTPCCGG